MKTWIAVSTGLWDDPRVLALCERLGIDEATACGGLCRVWFIAAQHGKGGEVQHMTLAAIDRKTGIPGFGQALVDIGIVEQKDACVVVSGASEMNPDPTRSSKSARQARWRERQRLSVVGDDPDHGCPLPRVAIRPRGDIGGFVYAAWAVGSDTVKIGFSSKDPNSRIASLNTASAARIVLLGHRKGTIDTERDYHDRFAGLRLNGEWFRLDAELRDTLERDFGAAFDGLGWPVVEGSNA